MRYYVNTSSKLANKEGNEPTPSNRMYLLYEMNDICQVKLLVSCQRIPQTTVDNGFWCIIIIGEMVSAIG